MLTYTTWLAGAANLAGTLTTNPFFLIEAPLAIDYAELRLYRDLDLISAITTDATQSTVANNRNISIPAAFVVVNGVNVVTPINTAPDSGTRNQLQKVSEDYLDFVWPNSTGAQVPTLYALRNQTQLLLGPWPDQSGYKVEFVGTQRPAPLSAGNPATFLSTNLPDLFLTATMIHIAGYQKNFGAQSDDPRSAQSWEIQYNLELASANHEEMRKRYRGTVAMPPPGMSPMVPTAPPQG